jgi:coiled-coil domain-containing protein 130
LLRDKTTLSMGERKGQNIWIPPDFDPAIHGSRNGYHNVHALRERAAKLHLGILIIRFEAPWGFWCGGCGSHVERGVRYNAEKKKVGNYYTTPIFAFRMKCHLCDNHFTFETDPKNCEYKITDGARRKIESWDPAATEVINLPDADEKAKRASNAMYRLEHDASDQAKAKQFKPAVEHLLDLKDDTTRRDYDSNAHLRLKFRTEKRRLQKIADDDARLKTKASIEVDLVPEHMDDVAIAQATTFRSLQPQAARLRVGSVFASKSKTRRSARTQAVDAVAAAKNTLLKTARRQIRDQSTKPSKASIRSSLGLARQGEQAQPQAVTPAHVGLVGDYLSSSDEGDN